MTRQAATTVLWLASFSVWMASAQTVAVTQGDVERLYDLLFEAETVVARLRTGDSILRRELREEMADIRTEVDALGERVRQRPLIPWVTYVTLRDRIEDVSRRARSEVTVTGSGGGPAHTAPYRSGRSTDGGARLLSVPGGTELETRLLRRVDPATARDGDRVEAAVVEDYAVDGAVVIPAGSLLRGVVVVQRQDETEPGDERALAIRFEDVIVDFATRAIDADVVSVIATPLHIGDRVTIRFE